jgi:hypothetical protein
MQYYDVYQRYVFGKQLDKYTMFINDTSGKITRQIYDVYQRYVFDKQLDKYTMSSMVRL